MSDANPPPVPSTYYQGRRWDAPFTDDALPLPGIAGDCQLCGEAIGPEDDAVWMPYTLGHLECHLRSALGSVQHLEGRCSCGGEAINLPSDEYATYREGARATMLWLIENNRGRFHS